MLQLLVLIIATGCLYLLIAFSFTFLYYPSKFFNLNHAIVITLGAYITFWILKQLYFPLEMSIPLALIFATLVGISTEIIIFRPLRNKGSNSFILLLASLGLYIVLQNIVSLIWGDDKKSIRTKEIKVGNEISGIYITNTQIAIIVVSTVLFVGLLMFLHFHKTGKQIRAISSNEELANIFGIDSNKVFLWSFIIGYFLAAIVGILVAFDTDMTPTMGFNLLLYGIVAMIIGGVGNNWGLVGGAFLLASAQHLGSYYIESKWMDAIAYLILIGFLIWQPLGFSGRRLKKVKI